MSLPVLQARSCGECDACCVVYEIDEPGVVKGQHERCTYSKPDAGGCSRYLSRPKTCRDFECLWLRGLGADEHRPDRCGFVVREIENGALPQGGLVAFTEIWDGALADGAPGGDAARESGFHLPTLVIRRDGTKRAIYPTTQDLARSLRPG